MKALKWFKSEVKYSINTIKNILIKEDYTAYKNKSINQIQDYINTISLKENNKSSKNINCQEPNLSITINNINNIDTKVSPSFPITLDEHFSKYLIKFMNSPRNKDNPTININNLLFLTGEERSGKTWFLRQTAKKFIMNNTPYKNFVIHIDCSNISNFDSFLFFFEEEMINDICKRINYARNHEMIDLLNIESLLYLLFFRYEKRWLEVCLYKELLLMKDGNSPLILNDYFIDDLIHKYLNKQYNETPLFDCFEEICQKLNFKNQENNEDNDLIKKSFYLIQRILIKRESFNQEIYKEENKEIWKFNYNLEHMKDEYEKKISKFEYEEYRTGLNVTEYLLDVVNYISGYHESQILEEELGYSPKNIGKEISNEDNEDNNDNVDKVDNADKEKNSIEKFHYKKHRIQSVLILEGIQKLDDFNDSEQRSTNWIQQLILRLYRKEGYRNHFPVICETNNLFFYENEIYNDIWDHKYRFPTLYFQPTQFKNSSALAFEKFTNNYQKTILLNLLANNSIRYYDAFCKTLKKDGLLGFKSLLNLNADFLKKERNIFLYKINSLYLNPKLERYYHNNSIDYYIYDFLNQWKTLAKRYQTPELNLRNRDIDEDFLRQNITQACLEANIIMYERYSKKVKFANSNYIIFSNTYVKNRYSYWFNSIIKKILIKKFSIFDAFVFKWNFITIGYTPNISGLFRDKLEYTSKKIFHGYNIKYDVPMELYKGKINDSYTDPITFIKIKNVY